MTSFKSSPSGIPHDPNHVNLADEADVAYWCEHFRVDQKELRAAVEEVGDDVGFVAERIIHENQCKDCGSS